VIAVWLWSAGTTEGVTGDREKACENAACYLGSAGATAVVEQARFVLLVEGESLDAGYETLTGAARWVACRHPGGRVSWSASPAKPEMAA
jgi:hypothetical protein